MASDGLGEMFEGDFADTYPQEIPLTLKGPTLALMGIKPYKKWLFCPIKKLKLHHTNKKLDFPLIFVGFIPRNICPQEWP